MFARIVRIALGVSLLATLLAGWSYAESPPSMDPRVLEDTAGGQTGHFVVVLRQQARIQTGSLSGSGWSSRGHRVVDALRQSAGATQGSITAKLDALGAHYRTYWIVNAIAVEGGRDVVEVMAARSDVVAIESDREFRMANPPPMTAVPFDEPARVTPADTTPTSGQWNIDLIHAPDVWALGHTGQGMVFAAPDTGVQWDHPALKPHYRGWNGTTADHNYNWWDAIHTPIVTATTNVCGYSVQAPCDDDTVDGHGTKLIGLGVGDDGATVHIGVAPGAQWIDCRNQDQGVARPTTIVECLQFLLAPTDLNGNNPNPDLRPNAINNSYTCHNSPSCSDPSIETAIQNLAAAGVFLTSAAGNNGPNCATIQYPEGLLSEVMTVGATGNNVNPPTSWNTLALFSSRGPVTQDGSGRLKPELVAPGDNVRSSRPTNAYEKDVGTSFAAPEVAGVVMLLWSAFPALAENIPDTVTYLEQSADPVLMPDGETPTCGNDLPNQIPNNSYGYGRVNALAAYNSVAAGPAVTWTPTATITPTSTTTPTATITPTSSATPSDTVTSTATSTPTSSDTVTATASPTLTPTATDTSTPTLSPSVTSSNTVTVTPTESPTVTFTSTESPTPTESPTTTMTPTESPSAAPTLTQSPTPTLTSTPTEAVFHSYLPVVFDGVTGGW